MVFEYVDKGKLKVLLLFKMNYQNNLNRSQGENILVELWENGDFVAFIDKARQSRDNFSQFFLAKKNFNLPVLDEEGLSFKEVKAAVLWATRLGTAGIGTTKLRKIFALLKKKKQEYPSVIVLLDYEVARVREDGQRAALKDFIRFLKGKMREIYKSDDDRKKRKLVQFMEAVVAYSKFFKKN